MIVSQKMEQPIHLMGISSPFLTYADFQDSAKREVHVGKRIQPSGRQFVANRYVLRNKTTLDIDGVVYYSDADTVDLYIWTNDSLCGWNDGELELEIWAEEDNRQSVVFPIVGNTVGPIAYYRFVNSNRNCVKFIPRPEPVSTYIPKVIYNTNRTTRIESVFHYVAYLSMLLWNPDCECVFYEKHEARSFIRDHDTCGIGNGSSLLDTYDTIIPGAFQSDLFRYCLLYFKGGIYADAKFIYRRSLTPFLKDRRYLFTRDMSDFQYANGFFCVEPHHETLPKIIRELQNRIALRKFPHPLQLTGPTLMFDCVSQYGSCFKLQRTFINGECRAFTEYKESTIISLDDNLPVMNVYYHQYYSNATPVYNIQYANGMMYIDEMIDIDSSHRVLLFLFRNRRELAQFPKGYKQFQIGMDESKKVYLVNTCPTITIHSLAYCEVIHQSTGKTVAMFPLKVKQQLYLLELAS